MLGTFDFDLKVASKQLSIKLPFDLNSFEHFASLSEKMVLTLPIKSS